MSAEPTDLHEADAMGNEMLATVWAFLQEHGFAVLALIIIYAIVRPKIDAHLQRKHREQVMKRATGGEQARWRSAGDSVCEP